MWLIDKTNRSFRQTMDLFELLDFDFEKLKNLESKIQQKHVGYCPSTLDEVENILKIN